MLLLKDCMSKATEIQDEDGDEGVKVFITECISVYILI